MACAWKLHDRVYWMPDGDSSRHRALWSRRPPVPQRRRRIPMWWLSWRYAADKQCQWSVPPTCLGWAVARFVGTIVWPQQYTQRVQTDCRMYCQKTWRDGAVRRRRIGGVWHFVYMLAPKLTLVALHMTEWSLVSISSNTTWLVTTWHGRYVMHVGHISQHAHCQVLMYQTAVYTLVNGGITHQKPQISKNVILCSVTLPKCRCTAEQYHIFWYLRFLMCNAAVN